MHRTRVVKHLVTSLYGKCTPGIFYSGHHSHMTWSNLWWEDGGCSNWRPMLMRNGQRFLRNAWVILRLQKSLKVAFSVEFCETTLAISITLVW